VFKIGDRVWSCACGARGAFAGIVVGTFIPDRGARQYNVRDASGEIWQRNVEELTGIVGAIPGVGE